MPQPALPLLRSKLDKKGNQAVCDGIKSSTATAKLADVCPAVYPSLISLSTYGEDFGPPA